MIIRGLTIIDDFANKPTLKYFQDNIGIIFRDSSVAIHFIRVAFILIVSV